MVGGHRQKKPGAPHGTKGNHHTTVHPGTRSPSKPEIGPRSTGGIGGNKSNVIPGEAGRPNTELEGPAVGGGGASGMKGQNGPDEAYHAQEDMGEAR